MNIISVKSVFQNAACLVADSENLDFGDLDSTMANLSKLLFEAMAESEVEKRCGMRPYARGPERTDYRNGYRTRDIQMSYQVVEIKIPRLRGQGYIPSYLEPNRRAIAQTETWAMTALLSGLSRADVIRLLESSTGCRPSDRLLARVQVRIDKEVVAFRTRPLLGRYQYLYLDAAWAKDIVGVSATHICILTAVGVTCSGEKEILGFERKTVENEANWRGFIQRLVERGLNPADLVLVISDEHKGILGAVSEVLGDVSHQYCWAHRVRNVRKAVSEADRHGITVGLQKIYDAKSLSAAKDGFRQWKTRWQKAYPRVVKSVEEDLEHLLAFFSCEAQHWEYIRTSNPIERVFREFRAANHGIGAFANKDACYRSVFRVFNRLNEKWKGNVLWDDPRRRKRQNKKRAQQLIEGNNLASNAGVN